MKSELWLSLKCTFSTFVPDLWSGPWFGEFWLMNMYVISKWLFNKYGHQVGVSPFAVFMINSAEPWAPLELHGVHYYIVLRAYAWSF